MSELGTFLDFAIPLAEKVLVPIAKAFFQANPHLPIPPALQPFLDVREKHAAIARGRVEAEKKP